MRSRYHGRVGGKERVENGREWGWGEGRVESWSVGQAYRTTTTPLLLLLLLLLGYSALLVTPG